MWQNRLNGYQWPPWSSWWSRIDLVTKVGVPEVPVVLKRSPFTDRVSPTTGEFPFEKSIQFISESV